MTTEHIVCVRGNSLVGDIGGVWCSCAGACPLGDSPLAFVYRCAGGCDAVVAGEDQWCLGCTCLHPERRSADAPGGGAMGDER